MLNLTDEQIAFIENDIEARGIKSPGLHIDLLDHICCIIENELDEYDNFNTVYEKTITLFGSDGLHEIQKETDRLLTFKHYYIMNSTMKISGYVSAALILIGTIFKFHHYPGASFMLQIGMIFLTFLFLPLMFILKFKSEHESNRSITLSVIGGVAAICISVGISFKMMHWPGATTLLYSGFGLLIVGYLPIYLFSVYNKTSNKINAVSTVVLIVAGVSLLFASTNSTISGNLRDNLFQINDNLELSNRFLEEENDALYKNMIQKISADTILNKEVTELKSIHENAVKLIDFIKETKLQIIANAEKISVSEAASVKLEDLKEPTNYDHASAILFKSGDAKIVSIKNELQKYSVQIQKIYPETMLPFSLADSKTIDGEIETWEVKNFEYTPISLVLHKLSQLELDIRTMEAVTYNKLFLK